MCDRSHLIHKVAEHPEQRFADAYLRMAKEAKYRPMGPTNGATADKSTLAAEARHYPETFLAEDNELTFRIGCTNYTTNRASVFVIEAARLLCSGDEFNPYAVRLLRMAIKEIETTTK